MLVITKKIQFDAEGMPLFGMFEPDTDEWELWYRDSIRNIHKLLYKGFYSDCRTIQLECCRKKTVEIVEYIRSYQSKTETKPVGVFRRLWQW